MSRPPGSWRPSPFLKLSAGLHVAGSLVLALRPDAWLPVAGVLLADHLTLVAGGCWPKADLLGPNLIRLPPGPGSCEGVALTFDDGPDPHVTPHVLDVLDRHGAPATFFCIGRRAAQHPEIVGEIARRGHRVENHSWSHPNTFFFYGPGAVGRELARAQEVLAPAAGRTPELFRAPAGIRGPWLDRALARSGLRLVSWTRRGFDTVRREPARVLARLEEGLAGGDVLLLHDGSAARTASGSPVVLEVLPRLLDTLAARSLRPVLFGAAPPPGGLMEG